MNYDLTVGKPSQTLWRYTLPMFISVVFQQLYNIADSAIAGSFAGEDALAAIGASYPITMIFMAVATGSNVGCTVVLSQFFGAKKYTKLKTAAYTALIFGLALSTVLTVTAIIFSPLMLTAINTPNGIFSDAQAYMNIYLGGFAFLYLYNMANGVFNALGDSKTPLYLLICSSVGNVVLDYVFVAICGFGVRGAAWATFIAQGFACAVAVLLLLRRLKNLEISEKPSLFSVSMLGIILGISIPSIIQNSFVSVGNLLIQSIVNSCGESVIAGFSAALKLNTFAITSFTTMAGGVSAFSAQNIGADKYDRIGKGLKAGIIFGVIISIPFTLMYTVFAELPLGLFMKDGGNIAMETGKTFLYIVSPFYAIICAKLMSDAVLRGAKAMSLFMTSTLIDLVVRVVLAFVLFPKYGINAICYAWVIGWWLGTALAVGFYLSGIWKRTKRLS